jgi:hypothetical protein
MSDKVHLELTLASVAGCKPVTFRDWRRRNGLLADGGELYSMADIAVVQTVVVLTGLGLPVQIAVDAAMKALPIFEKLFTNDGVNTSITNIIAVYPNGRSELFAYPRFANESATDGACVIVDAITIAGHVLHELDALRPPKVTSPDEFKVMAKNAQAAAWMPKKESAAVD